MNNTMVREIHGAKINPKSSLKIRVRKIRGGANYASKYGVYIYICIYIYIRIIQITQSLPLFRYLLQSPHISWTPHSVFRGTEL
jgi:hypothetical protein